MVGRHEDTSVRDQAAAARSVREWFETLPFHRGMSLLGVAVLVPAVLIGGTIALSGGSKPGRTPDVRESVTAAAPPRHWDAYVPPRRVVPTPARTQRRSITLMGPEPTPTATPRPSPSRSCPASLKRWQWFWDICRYDTAGHKHG